MYDFAPVVAKDHQNEQKVESNCRDNEKIDRTLICMIVQESPPSLRRLCIRRAPWHEVRNGSFGNLETQPEQLPVNPGCTPQRIGLCHCANKMADLTADRRSPRAFASRLESPEQFETL